MAALNPDQLRAKILVELTDQWMRDTPKRIPMIVLAAAFVGALLMGFVPQTYLIVWFVAITLGCSARYVLYLRFVKINVLDVNADRAKQHLLNRVNYSLAFVGLAWGCSLVMGDLYLVPSNAMLIVNIISAGMAILAVNGMSQSAGRIFAITIFTPFVLWGLGSGSLHKTVFAIACIIYCVLLLSWARSMFTNVVNTMMLRHENDILVEELRHAKEAAEKANLEKSRFLAAASHDLRQPMQGLWLFVGNLRQKLGQPQAPKILDHIENTLDAMRSLFDALLNISQLDAGNTQVQLRPYAVQHSLDRIATEFSAECDRKMLRFKAWPSCAIVYTDPLLLDRILMNFVSNAVKYTDSGGILVGCRRRGEQLEIQVWDTGPGIARQDQALIFSEFFQLNNPERDRNKGLGLGLSISQRLAKALAAPIALHSRVGQGSCFSITLPLSHDVPAEKLSTPDNAPISNVQGLRVAFVDDEASIVQVVRDLCQQWGVDAVCAHSQAEILAALGQQAPDFILSDYRLREGQTGLEVIKAIRKRWPSDNPIGAALLTGDTETALAQATENAHIALVYKPISEKSLLTMLVNAAYNRKPNLPAASTA